MQFKKIAFVFLLTVFSFACYAQLKSPYRKGRVMHRIGVGAVVSYYKNHPQHTIDTKPKPGFCFSYKSEIFLGKKSNLLAGLEYFNQGLSFKGYYSMPGHTYLFDESFAYLHEIRVQEVHLPLALKVAFNSEKDRAASPYFFLGVGVRYIIGSYAIIVNDSTGRTVYDGKSDVDFQYQFVTKKLNTFFHGGLGLQRNFRKTGGAAFFEITYKYGISRLRYPGHDNSNNLFIKDAHLLFTVGFRR